MHSPDPPCVVEQTTVSAPVATTPQCATQYNTRTCACVCTGQGDGMAGALQSQEHAERFPCRRRALRSRVNTHNICHVCGRLAFFLQGEPCSCPQGSYDVGLRYSARVAFFGLCISVTQAHLACHLPVRMYPVLHPRTRTAPRTLPCPRTCPLSRPAALWFICAGKDCNVCKPFR